MSAEAFVKPVTDYRALRKEAREKQRSRRTLRYPICLDTALLDEHADLEEEVRQETVDSIGSDGEKHPVADRAGSLTAEGRLEALEERMRQASLVAVFLAPSAEDQAARNAAVDRAREDEDATQVGVKVLAIAKTQILDAFSHWLDHEGNPIPADQFGREDLADMVGDWTQGMIFGLSREITDRSVGAADLPFSVQRSLLPRTSDATSK